MSQNIFLPHAEPELRQKLERLIELSMAKSKPIQESAQPLWSAAFFGVEESPYWEDLSPEKKSTFLKQNSANVLKETISIEHAGIAYGHRMALGARTQEEQHYYTNVASEELQHLMWLKRHCAWVPETDVSSFADMIAGIIQNEGRLALLLLIQVFLEGWGIHYYSSLVEHTDHPDMKLVFENILRDESRHHAGGVILFKDAKCEDHSLLIPKIQALVDTVRIGPFLVARSLVQIHAITELSEIVEMLKSISAQESALSKTKIVHKILAKVLPETTLRQINWTPLTDSQMARQVFDSLKSAKTVSLTTETSL